MFRKIVATAALTASAIVVAPGIANAQTARTVQYQLTSQERSYACGNFGGTIIYGDGSSLDCHSGVATLPAAS